LTARNQKEKGGEKVEKEGAGVVGLPTRGREEEEGSTTEVKVCPIEPGGGGNLKKEAISRERRISQ